MIDKEYMNYYQLDKGENYDADGSILTNYIQNIDTYSENLYLIIEDKGKATLQNMSNMFSTRDDTEYMRSYNFVEIDLSNCNTSIVTDMSNMFYWTRSLSNISNFDTSNVTNMSYMFYGCENLYTVPNYNTSKVTDMSKMFAMSCVKIVPNLNTSNVTNASGMFDGSCHLPEIPNFDFSKVTDISEIFYSCYNLTTIPNFNTVNVTNFSVAFSRLF